MTIKDIYEKFGTPPNLQEHMLRVAKIVVFIRDHWNAEREAINWNEVVTIALLHDLANIVKFDMDKYPQFLGEEIKRIDFWKQKQKEIVEKYGSDDHDATKKMLEEINVSQDMIDIILNKSFGNSKETEKSESWPLKILYFADLLVLPNGIGTMEQRLEDVKARMPKYTSRPDFPDLINACHQIESQIQENFDVPVSQITNESVNSTTEDFLAKIV